jgi:hypothetical protein
MMRIYQTAPLILLASTVTVGAASMPKDRARPLTPVFRQDASGWRFLATFKNTAGADADLRTLLHESSLMLDGKVFPRQMLKFGGRSNLPPGESWSFTIETGEYLGRGATLSEGRHTLTLRFGGQEFGPVEFVWIPAEK